MADFYRDVCRFARWNVCSLVDYWILIEEELNHGSYRRNRMFLACSYLCDLCDFVWIKGDGTYEHLVLRRRSNGIWHCRAYPVLLDKIA